MQTAAEKGSTVPPDRGKGPKNVSLGYPIRGGGRGEGYSNHNSSLGDALYGDDDEYGDTYTQQQQQQYSDSSDFKHTVALPGTGSDAGGIAIASPRQLPHLHAFAKALADDNTRSSSGGGVGSSREDLASLTAKFAVARSLLDSFAVNGLDECSGR